MGLPHFFLSRFWSFKGKQIAMLALSLDGSAGMTDALFLLYGSLAESWSFTTFMSPLNWFTGHVSQTSRAK
jgi:hypothetical protein